MHHENQPSKSANSATPFDPIIRAFRIGERIGKSTGQVYKLAKNGELKLIKLGNRSSGAYLSEIERFLAAQQDTPDEPTIAQAQKLAVAKKREKFEARKTQDSEATTEKKRKSARERKAKEEGLSQT